MKGNRKISLIAVAAVLCAACIVLASCGALVQEKKRATTEKQNVTTLPIADRKGSAEEPCIAMFGDSITCFGDFSKHFPDKNIANLGVPGDKVRGLLARTSQLAALQPETVFILVGINDMAEADVDDLIAQYEKLIDAVKQAAPNATLHIQSVMPVADTFSVAPTINNKVRDFNKKLQSLCENDKLDFIDLYSLYQVDGNLNPKLTVDGIHLTEDAYDLWVERIRDLIRA